MKNEISKFHISLDILYNKPYSFSPGMDYYISSTLTFPLELGTILVHLF